MAGKNQGNNNSGGGLPFYMREPDVNNISGPFIELRSDGKYDIIVEVGLRNLNDKEQRVVRFVNDKPLGGTLVIKKGDNEYKFEGVSPNKKGNIELVITPVHLADVDSGTKPVVITKDMLKKVASQSTTATPGAVTEKKITIVVNVSRQGPDGMHSVTIQLLDPNNGNPIAGEAEINASQEFECDGVNYPGYHKINITNPSGVSVRMKAKKQNEGFLFRNLQSMETTRKVLLKTR